MIKSPLPVTAIPMGLALNSDLEKRAILVHASNVTGLGATWVVRSLVSALERKRCHFDYVAPGGGVSWIDELCIEERRIIRVTHFSPRGVSRMLECLFSGWNYQNYNFNLVLGDLPIRHLNGQVVLVHQLNLVSTGVNNFSSGALSFRVMRMLFRILSREVVRFVVQSEVMRAQLSRSYPEIEERITVIPQPPPEWLIRRPSGTRKVRSADKRSGLTLFYPAAGYIHKNHALFMTEPDTAPFFKKIKKLIVTLEAEEAGKFRHCSPKIINIGRVSPSEMVDIYREADALFYPSLAESYGLPLVEAMVLGLPVICADLPYARWMCGAEAVYFDPTDISSATIALKTVRERLSAGWQPDWKKALAKLPKTWDDVASQFIRLFPNIENSLI